MEFEIAGLKKKILLGIAAVSILLGTVAVMGLNINPQEELIITEASKTNELAKENLQQPKGNSQKAEQESKKENNLASQSEIYVHVVGAVTKPNLYKMKEGQRVYDVIQLAKPTKQADLEQVNLAELLQDGTQIVIPLKGAKIESVSTSTKSSTVSGGAKNIKGNTSGKININYAGAEQLEELPGVGPALAQKIISYRKAKGRFKTIDELTNVPGIGEKKLDSMRSNLTL